MKHIIFYISLLFVLGKTQLNAQCIPNHEFSQYCDTVIYKDGAPTFADACVFGWMPSHGTPQIAWHNFNVWGPENPTTKPLWRVAYMWADGDDGRSRGEGILAPYSFKKGHTYKISLRYAANLEYPTGASDAEFRLIAAQDINRPSTWKYGNLIPSATRQQSIATVVDRITDWKSTPVYTFTPNDNYNQFWIYPYTTVYNQYNLYVDWAYVCREECESSIYYKQGILPVGEPKSGYIYIGSSYGGSSPVTVSPTSQTTMTAAKEITFKPEFTASVTSGTFTAKIESCPGSPVYTRPGETGDTSVIGLPIEENPVAPGGAYEDEYGEGFSANRTPQKNETIIIDEVSEDINSNTQTELRVFPNPIKNKLKIEFYSKKEGKIKIRILNNVGNPVKEIVSPSITKGPNYFEINTEIFSTGIYLIQFFDVDGKVTVKKIQKIN